MTEKPSAASSNQVTALLSSLGNGDDGARNELLEIVYHELRRMAERYMRRERPGHTLQATSLVHEAYIKLVNQHSTDWQSRAHFFSVATQMMRRILVDYARKRRASKRGSGEGRVTWVDDLYGEERSVDDVLAVDAAITRLGELDERQARVVELRYFGGLSVEEVAQSLEISTATVKRDWLVAKAWLLRELSVE